MRKGSTTLNRTEEEMAAAFSLRLHAAASDAADVKQQRRVHESSDIYWWMVRNEQCNILEDSFLFSCHSLFGRVDMKIPQAPGLLYSEHRLGAAGTTN